MLRGLSDASSLRGKTYGRPMKTHDVAPRTATIERDGIRYEGRPASHWSEVAAAAAGLALAIALAACTPGASTVPGASVALPSVALPSVDVSAAASAASGAAIAALDQIDTAIAANQTAAGLTADEASALQALATGIRTSLQTGDTSAARTAVENLSTKVDSFAAKLNTDTGAQLKAAIAALKAALPAS
jgi:hypothetical protein